MKTLWISLILVLALGLGSCGFPPAITETSPVPSPSDVQETPTQEVFESVTHNPPRLGSTPESVEMPPNPPVEKFVSLSKNDLAGRLQIEADRISLVKAEEMVWPDSALGCPSPGKVYTQGHVPGFRVWLQAENVGYVYHTDLIGQVILCLKQGPDGSMEPVSTVGPNIGVPIK